MLVLTRKPNENLTLDGGIKIKILGVRGSQVKIGIEAPKNIGIARDELLVGNNKEGFVKCVNG